MKDIMDMISLIDSEDTFIHEDLMALINLINLDRDLENTIRRKVT